MRGENYFKETARTLIRKLEPHPVASDLTRLIEHKKERV
jgi:hypothetical protein